MEIYKGDPNNNDFIQNHARVMMGQQVPQEDFVYTAWLNYYRGFEAGYEAGKVATLGQIPTPSGAWPPVVKINQ
jgi:hypothetical protein